MYSKIEQVPDTVNLNIVYLDNEPYDYMQLPFWSNIAVRKTSDYYNRMLYRGYIDPFAHSVNRRTRHLPDFLKHYTRKRLINTEVNASQYPEWLFGFLDRQTGGGLERLDLIKQYYIYRNGNYLPLEKSDTLFVVKKPSSHE